MVADNLLYPGAPDYIALMQSRPEQHSFVMHKTMLEYSKDQEDIVGVSVMLTDGPL